MASKLGQNAFTVQESVNMSSFSDYNYEQFDVSGDTVDSTGVTSTYITSSNPAKKVVIYDTDGTLDNDDELNIYLNGETDSNKVIVVDGGRNLPFTISGLMITSLTIKMHDDDTTSGDVIDLLSFH
jgi:hypothetical protein|tara:strand:+ start:491 stop:868 length:378 start_codon:yes stop_codon:yes gene_type:complete